ncbi:ABC transporter permease [Glycomyces tenuis]|uniref:ABC transporter permease n=1 Tax=Glycomyces tenuis TaxID=58116 RepID=UPI0004087BBE|nr:ABC transporter permease [Glycomyces tenuis]
MNPAVNAYKTGWRRALIETRISLATPSEVVGIVFPLALAVTVLLFLRGVDVDDSPVSLGSMNMPSLIGMMIVWGGALGVLSTMLLDRTNGTMLRAKSMPGGMTGYLVGKLGMTALVTAFNVVVLLVVGLVFFDGVEFGSPDRWLLFLAVLALGLVATIPLGAVLGALFDNPSSMALVMMPFMGLVAISGIFYPVTALPEWLQVIGQVFPTYWTGLGMRHALLPDSAVAVEIGGDWRTLTMFIVLAAWAVASLAFAPKLLSRMARRESGSTMTARREKMQQNWG